jgi:hypothetical protein
VVGDGVGAVSVGELVRRGTGALPDPWQLALVQRSVVWDEVRVARLLDSLLAGYPIGALLVCRVRQGGSVLVQTEDGREARPVDDTVTQLLDGQQRVNALVCLFSDAGALGRVFLDMTALRASDVVVTRRRDKRALIGRYIHWSPDGRFSDDIDDIDDIDDQARRAHFLDLARLAGWASHVREEGVRAARDSVLEDDAACVPILRAIDPEFGEALPPEVMPLAAERTRRLLDIWQSESIAVQHLVLDEPSDVLQVFTRINLEGVNVAGDDVFFAGVKTRWPAAEQIVHRVVKEVPALQQRLTGLRVLSRLASIQVDQGDMLPLRVDRLNGAKGGQLIAALEDLVSTGPQLARMAALSNSLIDRSGLGHGLRLVHDDLLDHVFGWVSVNPAADEPDFLPSAVVDVATYLVGATAYYYPTVGRDTFSRIALREAVAAGHAGESFPVERIVAAARRQWPELRIGQRWVPAGPVEVGPNVRLFLSILQELPFELPPGREIEWDHLFPQALATRMRWRGVDGSQRLQHHPDRGYVWHGANLWALDGSLNLAASDLWPSAKFKLLTALPDTNRRLPTLWPEVGFLELAERDALLEAEHHLREGRVDEGTKRFARFVVSRAERIRKEILRRFPKVSLFAADSNIDPWAFEERAVPPQLIRADLVLAAPVRVAPEEVQPDGLLSTNEMRAIALEFLRDRDPDRTHGEHYYDVLLAAEAMGKVSHGDPAPRMHGVLSNAPELFVSLGRGRFTWVPQPETVNRYWVMRSDRANRGILWAELQQGRLRQGWGWADDQDLRILRQVALSGGMWSESQRAAVRNRRMLSEEPNSIQIGDLIVIPHMPAERRVSLAAVIGPYEYSPAGTFVDYRHLLPVTLTTSHAGVDVNDPRISSRVRSSFANQNRMWNIDPVGPDVEQLASEVSAQPAFDVPSKREIAGR